MKNKSARIVINISLIFAIILGTFFINIPYIYGEDTPVNSEETREISIGESSGEPKEANKENALQRKMKPLTSKNMLYQVSTIGVRGGLNILQIS